MSRGKRETLPAYRVARYIDPLETIQANQIAVNIGLSDISPTLGYVRAGTLHVGGAESMFIRITDTPHTLMEAVSDPGLRYFFLSVTENPRVGIGIDYDAQGNVFNPLQVLADGSLVIQNGAVVMSAQGKTLLNGGYIDLTQGAASYDVANSGIRITAVPNALGQYGIMMKRSGQQTVFLDGANGWLRIGGTAHYWLGDADGLNMYDVYGTSTPLSMFSHLPAGNDVLVGNIVSFTSDIGVDMRLQSFVAGNHTDDGLYPNSWTMEAWGTGTPSYNPPAYGLAGIRVVATDSRTGQVRLWATDGQIYLGDALVVNPGNEVYLFGNLTQSPGLSISGGIISTPYTSDLPPSMADAKFGRLMPWITTGGTRVLLMGLGTTVGWWDLFNGSLIT